MRRKTHVCSVCQVDIVSLAVLADARPSFRPATYQRTRWGCERTFRFPVQKLLDWHARWAELEASPNPFALVVMAHLKARSAKTGRPARAGSCASCASFTNAAKNRSRCQPGSAARDRAPGAFAAGLAPA
jgi:hypothetical protein